MLAAQSPASPADSKNGDSKNGGSRQVDSKRADSQGSETPLDVGSSEYYPLEIGSEWQYEIGDRVVSARVTKHEKIGEQGAAKVDSFLGEQLISSEHIAVRSDGVYRTAFGGAVPTKPVMILKLPPKDGDVWAVETEIDGNKIKGSARTDAEKLDLPAGKFEAFRVSGNYTVTAPDGTTQEPAFKFWFAEGTGVVRLSTKTPDGEVVLNLKSFRRGKR
jgi:hypothetical protein